MDCQEAREKIGAYLDGELPVEQRQALHGHLDACAECSAELKYLRSMIGQLHLAARRSDVSVPRELWDHIERRTRSATTEKTPGRVLRLFRPSVALAASVAIFVGVTTFVTVWLTSGARTAQAAQIDYSVLLDGVAADANAAFQRFLEHYQAESIRPAEAHTAAPTLSFALPAQVAGGYRREEVYRLRFGDSPGIAARYQRGQEPLIVFFHRPVSKTHVGVHTKLPCIVGGRHGDRVEVGRWQLVHFSDPTTCHCVLSTLDVGVELEAVLTAIAPDFSKYSGYRH